MLHCSGALISLARAGAARQRKVRGSQDPIPAGAGVDPGLASALDDLLVANLQLRDFRAAAALVAAQPEHFAFDRDAIVAALEFLARGTAAGMPPPAAFRNTYQAAYFYNAAGDKALALQSLASSILDPPIGEVSQLWDPAFRPLWNEAGFRAIVERTGFGPPPYKGERR